MKNMTPAAMAQAVQGTLCGTPEKLENEVTAIVTDSRKILPGCLFAAIRGERSDGHAYIPDAVSAGAAAILAEEIPDDLPVAGIRVENTAKALQPLAAYYLDQLPVRRVGIIGSVGKTSTKEMVASVLSQRFRVLKTEGNFNNELGVPFTIFRLTEEDEIAVIEMGINHFGEMDRLGAIVRPDTVVMTNIGTAHMEFLGSREGILKAKSEVFAHMPEDGVVILNGDDDLLRTIGPVRGREPVRFGIEAPDAAIRASAVESEGLEGMRFRLCLDGCEQEIRVPSPGRHAVYNALAGAAVGVRYSLTPAEIAKGISSYIGLPGRMQIRKTEQWTVLDDCYNANPASMKAALSILREAAGRKVAILGDMGELGETADALHAEVGAAAGASGIDCLFCIGEKSRCILDAAKAEAERHNHEMTGMHFPDRDAFLQAMDPLLLPGDTILVKASHFMGFEALVERLCA